EAAVVEVLRAGGFRVVHFEDESFERQVQLAASASHIVSNHGAGLANILFMRPGSRVLELRRAGERERNLFFNLANAAQLAYYYQTADTESPAADTHVADLLVDTRALADNLAALVDEPVRS